METEKDNKLAFLDTAVLGEPDGHLTTSVYRKPTLTDQYLAFDSHHPQSVKNGIVDLRRFRACPKLRTQATLERSKVC